MLGTHPDQSESNNLQRLKHRASMSSLGMLPLMLCGGMACLLVVASPPQRNTARDCATHLGEDCTAQLQAGPTVRYSALRHVAADM